MFNIINILLVIIFLVNFYMRILEKNLKIFIIAQWLRMYQLPGFKSGLNHIPVVIHRHDINLPRFNFLVFKKLSNSLMSSSSFLAASLGFSMQVVLCHSVLSDSALWTVPCQAPLFMGIFQTRILDWVAMPSSRGSSQVRGRTQVSHIVGGFFTI